MRVYRILPLVLVSAFLVCACEAGRTAYEAPLRRAGMIDRGQGANPSPDPRTRSAGAGHAPMSAGGISRLPATAPAAGRTGLSVTGASKAPGESSDLAGATGNGGGPVTSPETAQSDPTDKGELGPGVGHGGYFYNVADLAPGERPASDTDEAGLWQVADEIEQAIRHSGREIRDPEVSAYLQSIACRLAGDFCKDIRVYVVRTPVFNASMAPNGMMNVYTGLLLRVANEAQLAAVIGHEIGHYLRRHSVQRLRDLRDKSNLSLILGFGLAVLGAPGSAFDLSRLAILGSIAAFSRDHEREADGYGLLLLARAGYDPREAAKVWDRVLRERDADPDADRYVSFYATHPPSAERRDALTELGAEIHRRMAKAEKGEARFRQVFGGFRRQFLQDEVKLRTFKRSMALLDMILEDTHNPAELIFFKGEIYRARGNEGDERAALDLYVKALEAPGTAPADIHRSMGLIYRRLDEPAKAAAAFRTYLAAEPDVGEREMIEHMIRRLETS